MNDYSEIQYGVSLIENVFTRKSEQDSRFNILLGSIRELFQKEVSETD